MRITAGRLGGRRLRVPRAPGLRPTAGRVRHAIFSMLADRIVGARVLDLYAGSGALGLEALSRGAASVVFVERSHRVAAMLMHNVRTLGVQAQARLLRTEVDRAIGRLEAEGWTASVVLADPPYASDEVIRTLHRLGSSGILAPRATVVLEHDTRLALPQATGRLVLDAIRVYGGTAVGVYHAPPSEPGRQQAP